MNWLIKFSLILVVVSLVTFIAVRTIDKDNDLINNLIDNDKKVDNIKEFSKLPIAVGFGVRDAKTAKEVALISDAVVIGSRIVKEIEDSKGDNLIDNIKKLMVEMKNSINNKAARK
mgnify:CR=1 FL=1